MISDEKLFDVAIAYHVRKKTQRDIAKEYDVSHVQISKYLKLAEQRGIITISINPPSVTKEDLQWYQIMFRELFGLEHLVLTPGANNSEKSHALLVSFAAKYITETYGNNELHVGLGLGRTIHDLCKFQNEMVKKTKWTYYPVCTSIHNKSSRYFDYEQLLRMISENWGGGFSSKFNNMLYFSESLDVDFHKYIYDYLSKLDMLITGIGSAFTLNPATREIFFSQEEQSEILTKNLVGDMVNFFFDIDGNIYAPQNKIKNPLTLEQLRATPLRIAVASGFHKVESIIGALRADLVQTLITDTQTAKHVIEYMK
ncbi:MAG: sugar-binding domain-containing protein [Sphaerochaeta sp.]|nr:sugar-binding domain-containing protein [Sphaerochaeta sp.]